MDVVFDAGDCDPEPLLPLLPPSPDEAPPELDPPDEAGGAVPDDEDPLLTSPEDELPLLDFTSRFPEEEAADAEVDASGEFEGDPEAWADDEGDELVD